MTIVLMYQFKLARLGPQDLLVLVLVLVLYAVCVLLLLVSYIYQYYVRNNTCTKVTQTQHSILLR